MTVILKKPDDQQRDPKRDPERDPEEAHEPMQNLHTPAKPKPGVPAPPASPAFFPGEDDGHGSGGGHGDDHGHGHDDHGHADAPPARSLKVVAPKRAGRRVAAILIGMIALIAACLAYVPWQQTIIGNGQVSVLDPMSRPQSVEALIPGRLIEWNVKDGDMVTAGQVIARLEDIDSKFLDPNQIKRITRQREALLEQRARSRARIARLEGQLEQIEASQAAAIPTARQRVQQSRQRLRAAEQSRIAAQKSAEIQEKVARQTAGERVQQAFDRVRQAEQTLAAAKMDLETSRIQRARVAELFALGLNSKRSDELAANDYELKRAAAERAADALKIARRDANIGGLARSQVDIEIQRVRTEVERAEANVDIAQRDILTANLDLARITADTTASLNSLGATIESARESLAKIEAELQKQDVELSNIRGRSDQREVRAPGAGRVQRLLRVGAGETVKAGDVLAYIAPTTTDRVVELMVTDNDVPLIAEGRKVRLQFAGWPALQFAGWPSISVGTFAGEVAVIDAVDDGTSRYRILVKPDQEAIASGKEDPWPEAKLLRPGAETTGWVMLGTVPLGFELWRQFNAFPPTVPRPPVKEKGKDDEANLKVETTTYDEAGNKEKTNRYIKIKSKK